jgi:hypothetical protein
MYKLVPWTPELDLAEFYRTAHERGFLNNSSQRMLVDSLARETAWAVWILYLDSRAVGSVGAHSFPEMGPNSYRIAARTCVFTDQLKGTYSQGLRTRSVITHHQNPTAQFLIPQCIEWAPEGSDLYITSNASPVGTQRAVHSVFGPLMERKGLMRRVKEITYRNTPQTVWQLYPDRFMLDLDQYPRWQ